MDLTMPVLDGWYAIRQVKADPQTRGIPILVLSAHDSRDNMGRAAKAGCQGFIAKPCLPEALLGTSARR